MSFRTITTISLSAALFLVTAVFAPVASAQEAPTSTINITAKGVFGPQIKKAEKAFKKIKASMMDAEGDAFDRLARKARGANEELKELKEQARRFKGGTISFYGVDLDQGLADSIRDWFVNNPSERGGAYHVYAENGGLVIRMAPPAPKKKAKKKTSQRKKTRKSTGGARESQVHPDATIFGQG